MERGVTSNATQRLGLPRGVILRALSCIVECYAFPLASDVEITRTSLRDAGMARPPTRVPCGKILVCTAGRGRICYRVDPIAMRKFSGPFPLGGTCPLIAKCCTVSTTGA